MNQKNKMQNMTWLIVAAFLDAKFGGRYRSRYTFLTQVAIQLSRSTQLMTSNIVYPLIPGAFSFDKVAKAIREEAIKMSEETPEIDLRSCLVNFCYDNTQTRPLKTTETGKGINKKSVQVRTMRIILKYSHPDPNKKLKFINIQFDQQHNPYQMAKNFPLGEVLADAMLINKKEDGSSGAINRDMPSASVRS